MMARFVRYKPGLDEYRECKEGRHTHVILSADVFEQNRKVIGWSTMQLLKEQKANRELAKRLAALTGGDDGQINRADQILAQAHKSVAKE